MRRAVFAFDPSFTGGVNVVGGRDSLFVTTASGGGSLARFDVGPRRGRTDRLLVGDHALFASALTEPFGPDYMGGLSIAGFAAAVPEPGVWLQLIIGFGCASMLMRARRTATA